MQSASVIKQTQTTTEKGETKTKAKKPRLISWETFQKKYLSREDGHTYEWSHGRVEKTRNTMGPSQLYIQFNLQELFSLFKSAGKVKGQLFAEPDLKFAENVHKRPDLAWLSREQTLHLLDKEQIEIPAFIIEIISNNDAAQRLAEKIHVYRQAGVQVVWLIYPNQLEVHVYDGPNLESMHVCSGSKVCSAAPALPGFTFEAGKIFEKSEEG